MVTGNEYIFENINKALCYVLDFEKKSLKKDGFRREAPTMFKSSKFIPFIPGSTPQIHVDSIDYPLSAFFNNAAEDKFIMTRLQSGRFSLKPNLRNRKFLFRGETEFHSPCKPNLFRNSRQKRFTKELMRGQEMYLLMLSHPLVQLLDLGVLLDGNLCRFEMNLYGLTQHYYNKTGFIDLTSDPAVATFFATNKYDSDRDVYTPITDRNHESGVLYYYSLDINQDFGKRFDGTQSPLSTIGLQVFPRSGRQYGFLYDHTPLQNFNDLPQLNAVRFKHDGLIAQQIWEQFKGGNQLFPEDLLEQHWKKFNANTKIISNRTIKLNQMFNPHMTLFQVEQEALSLGFEIKDYLPKFTNEELDVFYSQVEKEHFWEMFCSKIHIPGDKNGRMMKDLHNLPQHPSYRWAFIKGDKKPFDFDKGFVLRKYKDCLL